MTAETELRRGYGLDPDDESGDLLFEVDDRDDADTLYAALQVYSGQQWKGVRDNADTPSLALHYRALAAKADRLATRLEELLFPEPQPLDREGDPHFNGAFGPGL